MVEPMKTDRKSLEGIEWDLSKILPKVKNYPRNPTKANHYLGSDGKIKLRFSDYENKKDDEEELDNQISNLEKQLRELQEKR